MPVPKSKYQKRLTMTRAVSPPVPFSGSVSQLARSRRVSRVSAWGRSSERNSGKAGSTSGPLSSSQLPRGRIRMGRGLIETVTMVRRVAFRRASSSALRFADSSALKLPAASSCDSSSLIRARSRFECTSSSGGRLVGRLLDPTLKCRASSMSAKKAPSE